MSGFDRFCAGIAFVLGILGLIGLFTGCRANFTLPPILGVFPAFVGWGIIRAVRVAWHIEPDAGNRILDDEGGFQ